MGETGRCLQTRQKEHFRSTKTYGKGSNIATQALLNNRSIDFNNAPRISKGNWTSREEHWTIRRSTSVTRNYFPVNINSVMNSTLAFYFGASNLFSLLFVLLHTFYRTYISTFGLFNSHWSKITDNRKLQ